jgi:hypothetical protein
VIVAANERPDQHVDAESPPFSGGLSYLVDSGPTMIGNAGQLVAGKLWLGHHRRAAPGILGPLPHLQVVEITPSGFLISASRGADAGQSTSPKIGPRQLSQNIDGIDLSAISVLAEAFGGLGISLLAGGIEGGCDCPGACTRSKDLRKSNGKTAAACSISS